MNDTNVAPNNNLSPKRYDITFSELSDLMAPEIIPIELKFANDTKKRYPFMSYFIIIPSTTVH